jgi:CHAT domain-containing protein
LTAAFSATVYERYEKYIECLMSSPARSADDSQTVRAFETSELARARSLAELLQSTGTNLASGLDPQLAEQERSLRQSLQVKADSKVALLSRKEYPKEELAALETQVAQLEAQYKQVGESIRARYPAYEQMTHPAAWDLRRIQETVIADDQTLLLEYSLGADKSYVWAVTRRGLKSYELASQAQIVEAAQRAYKLLSAKPVEGATDEVTPALQELSRLILAPVAAELSRPRIIVVADRALNYIPFQLLPAPSPASEPLVSNYEVINAPSATILGELRQEAAQRGRAAKTLAAFGDPVFASNYAEVTGSTDSAQLASVQKSESEQWHQALRDIELNGDSFDPSVIKPLFFARQELANLRQIIAAKDALVASEFEATRERVLSTDLTQYSILHFATHGLLDPKRPERSGLVLSTVNREGRAQNGFVGLQDIYGLRAPVRLVVLSACQTGLGKDVRGEGLLGLTRGFMYAGASSVVASLWKVDDEATAALMKEFYSNLLDKGMTPAQALRAAQLSIRQKPEWRAPFYWAGFTLQGEYRQVIKPAPGFLSPLFNPTIILGGALLVLLAFVPLWYRRRKSRAARES